LAHERVHREIASGPIAQKRAREHDRALGQGRDRFEDGFGARADEVRNLDLARMGGELLASRIRPQPLRLRCANDDHRSPCPGMEAPGKLESIRPPSRPPRTGNGGVGREFGKGGGLHRDEDDGGAREEIGAILEDEGHRELSLGHDEIDRALTVLHAQELDQLVLERGSAK
jgi:hypothetical protein